MIKILSRVCAGVVLLLTILSLGLLFGPAGAVLEPLVRRYGGAAVPSLRVGRVDGSLYSGLALNDVALASGDRVLLAVSRLTLHPSWEELFRGNLWLSELELQGIYADAEDIALLAACYGQGNENENEEKTGAALAFKPLRVSFREAVLRTPQASVSVSEGFLNRDGLIGLSADLGGLPIRLDGRLSFSPASLSLDATVGTGRVSLAGRLEPPFDIDDDDNINADAVAGGSLALKIEELLSALPGLAAAEGAAEGELAGRFSVTVPGVAVPGAVSGFRGLSAKGSLRLTGRFAAAGGGEKIPLSASAPWSYEGGLFVSRIDAEGFSEGEGGAALTLKISADLRPEPVEDFVFVRGEAQNISLGRLSRALPLGVKLDGEGGRVDFWASADLTGKTAGKVFIRLPRLEADKKRLVEGLRVSVLLAPDGSVAVDGTGEVLGAKISATGGIEGVGFERGGTKNAPELRNPEMTFTARGVNSALLAAAFPALAPLAPAGTADVTVRAASRSVAEANLAEANPAEAGLLDRLALTTEVRSQALTLGGVRIDGIALFARCRARSGTRGAVLALESLTARIDKAPLAFSGEISLPAPGKPGKGGAKSDDWSAAELRFDGGVKGLDPGRLPPLTAALGGRVQGLFDAEVSVRGTPASPRVEAVLSESAPVRGAGSKGGIRIASIPVSGASPAGRVGLAASYADGVVTIPETAIGIPGGSLSFRGEVEIPKSGEPRLNFSGAARIDAGEFFAWQSEEPAAPVSGRAVGTLEISGPASGPKFSLLVSSDAIGIAAEGGAKAGTEIGLKNLVLDVTGTAQEMEVRAVRAEIGGGALTGKGGLSFGRGGRFKVDMAAKGIDIRGLLARFGVDSGFGGLLDGSLTLQGTPRRPEFVVRTTSPLTIRETLVDSLTATLTSPARGRFEMNASARLGELTLLAEGRLERGAGGWSYAAETELLDVDRLVSAKMPSMKGLLKGKVKAALSGRLAARPRRADAEEANALPVDILLTLPVFEVGGARFSEVSLPIRVLGDQMTARGSGKLCGGDVSVSADVSLPDQRWNAVLAVASLDIGAAAAPFLPQGEIVGGTDVSVKLRGNYGALMILFADGSFRAGEGYIHKIKAFELLAKGGRIDFEEIRGSFFWDGVNLRLNPGTQVTAKQGDPFYRYLSVSGPLGIADKELNLNFKGRFNINALNTVLGALKGAFQLVTGTLTGGGGGQLLRSALGKLVGLEERDFQDVTFQLKGSWSGLQLLNLKIDKSLEDYLPLKTLNAAEERKENEKKIQFNFQIPVGPGGGEDGENAGDQMKRQLLDNLLNQVY